MAGFDLIGAKELMFEIIPDAPWVIEGLLGTGLYILGGDSKIGKSWLVYDMALKVAYGASYLPNAR